MKFTIGRVFVSKKTPPNECPGYDTKQSDGEVQAVL